MSHGGLAITHIRNCSPRGCGCVCHRTKLLHLVVVPALRSSGDLFCNHRPVPLHPFSSSVHVRPPRPCNDRPVLYIDGNSSLVCFLRHTQVKLHTNFMLYFTEHNALWARPRGHRRQGFVLSHSRRIFRGVHESHPLSLEHRFSGHLTPAWPCATRLGLELPGSASLRAHAHLLRRAGRRSPLRPMPSVHPFCCPCGIPWERAGLGPWCEPLWPLHGPLTRGSQRPGSSKMSQHLSPFLGSGSLTRGFTSFLMYHMNRVR